MKAEFRFPAIVKAKTKGGRTPRHSVIVPIGEFTIRDLDDRQAPIAFVVTKTKDDKITASHDVRSFGGRLFVKTFPENRYGAPNDPDTLDDLLVRLETEALVDRGLLAPSLSGIRKAIDKLEVGETVLPPNIRNALWHKDLKGDDPVADAAIKLTDQIELDDDVRCQIAPWHAAAQKAMDDLICVNGNVYRLCGEPVYTVNSAFYGPHHLDVHFLDYRQKGKPSSPLTFSALARNDGLSAVALVESRKPKEDTDKYNGSVHDAEIAVFDPTFVRWRGEEMDFHHFATDFERLLNSGIKGLGEKYSVRIPRKIRH